jgi:hypothetical protein
MMSNSDQTIAIVGLILQFIQTIVVVGSVVGLLYQFRQFRRESLVNKITGLKEALDTLKSSEVFAQATSQALAGRTINQINWRRLLDDISFVAYLVDEGYTDPAGLFKLRGAELAALGKYLQQHPIADPQIDLKGKYLPAINLMNRAISF